MTIKRVLTIKDENYGDEFQVSSRNGYFKHENIVIFDIDEVAQRWIELTYSTIKDGDIICINKECLIRDIKDNIKELSNQLIDEIVESAIDNVNDDEETEWM